VCFEDRPDFSPSELISGWNCPGMRKVDAEFHFAKVISIELMVGTEERIQV